MIELKIFTADWCPKCRLLKPIMKKLNKMFGESIYFSYIQTDDNKKLVTKYNVKSIPLVVIERNNRIEHKLTGAHSLDTYEKILNGLL